MANQDRPRGFWPVRHLTGGEIRTMRYPVSGTVYKGDVVKLDSDGKVLAAAAGDDPKLGIAASYAATTDADPYVDVYVDPYIIFGVQSAGTLAYTNVGNCADHVAGSGTTYSVGYDPYHANLDGFSGHELSGTAAASVAGFKILGLVDRPDNAWGLNCDVEVIFEEHFLTEKSGNYI